MRTISISPVLRPKIGRRFHSKSGQLSGTSGRDTRLPKDVTAHGSHQDLPVVREPSHPTKAAALWRPVDAAGGCIRCRRQAWHLTYGCTDTICGRRHRRPPRNGRAGTRPPAEFCAQDLLRYAFADAEDERNQYTTVIHQVAARLRLDAVPYGENGSVRLGGDVVTSYEELIDVIAARLTDDATRPQWAGPVTGVGTINAFLRRLRSSLRPLRPIIRSDLTSSAQRRISTQDQQVTVVDLHNLHERAQRFAVGVVLAADGAERGRRPGRAAVHHDRRAEQVRPAGRQLAHQGSAAGHRGARTVARHHPHRGPADRQRGRTAHRVQLGHPGGRAARSSRGGAPRVRLPPRLAADPRDTRQTGGDVRVPAGDPGPAGGRVPVPGLGDAAG